MSALVGGLPSLAASLGPLAPAIALGFAGLALAGGTALALLRRRPDPMEKFRQAAAGATGAKKRGAAEGGGARRLRQKDRGDKLKKFADFLEPKDEKELSSARLKLIQAGYRSKSAVRTLHGIQFLLAMSLLVLGFLYTLITHAGRMPDIQTLALGIAVPGAVGYYLPRYWVEKRRKARQEQMTNGFPDALDMMLVCVEAGQSLDQAILRVSKEMRQGYPALAEELEIVSHEIRAGKDRAAVLKDFGDRAGTPDIASFVTVLIQSSTFGTSISDALRVYAAEMRDKRVMRAEEKANVLPTKLTLGTMLFTLPPLLIILLGPSMHSIGKMLNGGQ